MRYTTVQRIGSPEIQKKDTEAAEKERLPFCCGAMSF